MILAICGTILGALIGIRALAAWAEDKHGKMATLILAGAVVAGFCYFPAESMEMLKSLYTSATSGTTTAPAPAAQVPNPPRVGDPDGPAIADGHREPAVGDQAVRAVQQAPGQRHPAPGADDRRRRRRARGCCLLLLVGVPLFSRFGPQAYIVPPFILVYRAIRRDESGRMAVMAWYDKALACKPSRRRPTRNPLLPGVATRPRGPQRLAVTALLQPSRRSVTGWSRGTPGNRSGGSTPRPRHRC